MKILIIRCLIGLSKIASNITKKNRNIVIFGGKQGKWYMDNSMYLFEWFLENRPELKVYWITKSKIIYSELIKKNIPCLYSYSLKGIYILSKSIIGFYTNSVNDIALSNSSLPKGMQLIALRHGRSVKRVRFARLNHKISKTEYKERIIESKHIKIVISTSDFISDIQEECLNIGREKHIVTGYPRNDLLIKSKSRNEEFVKKYFGDKEFSKVVLYAPSWRHNRNATSFFPFLDFDKDKFFNYIKTENILFLLRPHVNDLKYKSNREFLLSLSDGSDNVMLATHEQVPDVNQLLYYIDILISDYSAIYHDFLLLDKPMIFIPYDINVFMEENGFLYNYLDLLPGYNVISYDNLISAFDEILSDSDIYIKERERLRNLIHKYQDGNSCERISELVYKIQEEFNE